VTRTEANESPGDEQREPGDGVDAVEVDRRTYLRLGGTAIAAVSSIAGCTGKETITEADSISGPAHRAGYGGFPPVAERISVPDPFAPVRERSADPIGTVTRIATGGSTGTLSVPDSHDTFAFDASIGDDLTVELDATQTVGQVVLGVFGPDGTPTDQVYVDADAPVYMPTQAETDGTHYVQVAGLEDSAGEYALSVSTTTTTAEQSPYEGTPAAVPGRIQAENFDIGGEGVAYHDTTEQNKYDTTYRDAAVDIRETEDESGAYNIGYFEDGEWLEYTVDPTPGTYDIHVRVASARSNRMLDLSLDGTDIGAVDVPNTGGWSTWETVTLKDVSISSNSSQVLRLEARKSGIDLNWIEFEAVETRGPYEGTPATVPGRIQVENFDTGGEGVAYHDTTEQNKYDTTYRDAAVDIRETEDESGAYNIGYFEDGEWLEYTVDPTEGTYDLRLRVASARSDRQVVVTLDGDELATVDVPNTGGWSTWETVTVEGVSIETNAKSALRVEAVGAGIDLNWVEFERVEMQGPFNGTVATLPGRIQAENFDIGGEGVAYHDTTEQNKYDTSYRKNGVDIRETKDESGAYNIGYFEDGEWLEYTVSPTPGTYDIHVRVASARSDRQLAVTLGDHDLGVVDVPNTGGWSTWETATLEDVSIETDSTSLLRIEAVGSGIDLNWVGFEAQSDQQPMSGSPTPLPGRIEAEDFDAGGEGVAYHDTTEQNKYDTTYRDAAVDIRETEDESGAYNIGYFEDGEWLEYTVDPVPGTYDLRFRVTSAFSDRQLAVTLDGNQLGTIDIPNTGGWSAWTTVTLRDVSIETDSESVLRVEAVGSGIDFNWFEVIEGSDSDYGELGYGDGAYGGKN